MKKLIISVAICILLTDCSLGGYFYVRNYSQVPVHIILLNTKFANDFYLKNGNALPYDSTIRPINNNTINKLKIKIKPFTKNQIDTEYILPPHSTVLIGWWGNGRISTKGIVIKKQNQNDTIPINKFNDPTQGPNAWYDIKN